jgi:ribose transport system substrate-binding protein
VKIHRLALLASLAISIAGCQEKRGGTAGGAAAGERLTIAVVPKGTTHEFWKSVHAGAVQAAQEMEKAGQPVDLIWKGPLREDDRELQIQVVEGFVAQGVSGIVLAPLDNQALVRPVEEAARAGVPTVIIDSNLKTDKTVSFVATDNYKGGQLAAVRMGELLGGKGKVLLLRYQVGSASTEDREAGFLKEMEKFPEIELVSTDQYAGATRETAKRAAENLLNRYGNVIQGAFAPNETSSIGLMLALQDIGKTGTIKQVGFDSGSTLVDALKAGQIQGLVVQNPMKMGYLGVKTMVAHLRGEPVEKRVDTGVVLITPGNMNTPESQELLLPPIEKYLSE